MTVLGPGVASYYRVDHYYSSGIRHRNLTHYATKYGRIDGLMDSTTVLAAQVRALRTEYEQTQWPPTSIASAKGKFRGLSDLALTKA